MMKPAVAGRIKLAFDATGLGQAFGSLLNGFQLPYDAVTITAGAAVSRKRNRHNVAKNALLGQLAVGLETKDLTLAHDLPLRSRLQAKIASFETKQTGKGNIVLDAKASDHHGDLAIATAMALYLSSVAINMQHEYKLEGWYG